MLISLLISLLFSNAVTLTRDKSILFSRIVITGLLFASFLALNNLFTKALEKGIGVYDGLFNVTTFTQLVTFYFVNQVTFALAIIALLTYFLFFTMNMLWKFLPLWSSIFFFTTKALYSFFTEFKGKFNLIFFYFYSFLF